MQIHLGEPSMSTARVPGFKEVLSIDLHCRAEHQREPARDFVMLLRFTKWFVLFLLELITPVFRLSGGWGSKALNETDKHTKFSFISSFS